MSPIPRLALPALFLLLLTALCPAGEGTPVSRPGLLRVTLESAIRMALEKNFTIQVQEFAPQIAREAVTQQLGVFDPVLTLGSGRDYNSNRNLLGIDGTRSDGFITRRDRLFDTGIEGVTPIGTEYRFGLTSLGNRGGGDESNSYSFGPATGLTQPLLRGAGLNANMFGIRIARTDVEISEWTLRDNIIDVITELVYVYNELHFSSESLKVAIRSRELARQLLQDNTRRVDIGVMSPLDVTSARAQVAAREEGVILADRTRLDNELLLKQIVTTDLEPMLGIKVEIADPPFTSIRLDSHRGIRDALELRPDYRNLLLGLQKRHITIAFRKNQLLPRLDLEASLGYLGFDTSFGNSLGRIGKGDKLSWSAGAVFSIPLGNHTARGSFNAARLEAAQTLVQLKQLEQQIVVDVEQAVGQVVSDRARIESTSEASRLAEESLSAGEQKLRAGTGTTFEVLELQKKLAEAQSAELRARADHNKAIAEYYRKTGRSLSEHHVELR